MANKYYGADISDRMPVDLTISSSTTSKGIELYINTTTTGITKEVVLMALEAIKNKIVVDTWPPA
jgi:hypothetical protein